MILPANIQTGRVEARFVADVVDGPDPDDEPDIIPILGEVLFDAEVRYWPAGAAQGGPMTIVKTQKRAIIDDQGFLCSPDTRDPSKAGPNRYIKLFATDDPDLGVVDWKWRATPRLKDVNGQRLMDAVQPVEFYLRSGETLDLTHLFRKPVPEAKVPLLVAESTAAAAAGAAREAAAAALQAGQEAQATRESIYRSEQLVVEANNRVGADDAQVAGHIRAGAATKAALQQVVGGGERLPREAAGSVIDARYQPGDARRYGWDQNPNAAAAAIRELITHRTGRITNTVRIVDDVVTIPAGTWTITEVGALLKGTPADGRRHRGLIIEGAGRDTTTIVFDPATDGYLFDNQDRMSRVLIRDMSFVGGSSKASFMNSVSNGGPKSMIFERCTWAGTWKHGFNLTGMDNNSEWIFYGCKTIGSYETFFLCDNFQALNHHWIGCDIEIATGDALHYKQGGHINVIGGSWIGNISNPENNGAGTFVRLDGPGGQAINRFYMEGVRFELRGANYKVIDCSWAGGNVVFKNVHDVGFQADNESNEIRHRYSATNLPIITYEDCYLSGRHEYIATGQADGQRRLVTYRNSTIRHHENWEDFIITGREGDAAGRAGAEIPIRVESCRSNAGSTPAYRIVDTTINGTKARNALLQRHTISLRTGFGEVPGSTTNIPPLVLPKNAVIIGVRSYAPANAATAVSTTWTQTLQDGDGTVIATISSGRPFKDGYSESREAFHVCDTENKRRISMISTTQPVNNSGMFLIEYLA